MIRMALVFIGLIASALPACAQGQVIIGAGKIVGKYISGKGIAAAGNATKSAGAATTAAKGATAAEATIGGAGASGKATAATTKDAEDVGKFVAKESVKGYHNYCNSKDERYNTTNCAAYKGTRETVRFPRKPEGKAR